MLGMRRTTLALVLTGGLTACGSDAPPTPLAASPAVNAPVVASPLNFWMGFNMDGRGGYPPGPASGAGLRYGVLRRGQTSSGAACVVTEAGELGCILEDHSSYVRGFLGPYEFRSGTVVGALHGRIRVVNSGEIHGSGKLYAAPGKTLADGASVVADLSITAGLLSDANRVLVLTIESLGEGITLSLSSFDRYYYGDSSLQGLSAVYPAFNVFGDPAAVSIDANGALFSQAASGCVISGQVAIIDPTVNVYAANLAASSCSTLNGAYQGLVTVAEIPLDNAITRLKLVVFNDTTFIAGDIIGW